MIGLTCALLMFCAQPNAVQLGTPLGQDFSGTTTVTYLGHSGWAVRTGDKLLVFDYQEEYGSPARGGGQSRSLNTGFIDPEEIASLDVYVFTTHSHSDHFDPVILDWQSVLPHVHYYFGWQAGDDPAHTYLIGPRASTADADVEVYTINSHHSGVPEVAYLVRVDGLVIYHNGDYRGEYLSDYEYLTSITNRVDIAFVSTDLWEQGQYIRQAGRLIELFDPALVAPMHSGRDESHYGQFAQMLRDRGAETEFACADRKGDVFYVGR